MTSTFAQYGDIWTIGHPDGLDGLAVLIVDAPGAEGGVIAAVPVTEPAQGSTPNDFLLLDGDITNGPRRVHAGAAFRMPDEWLGRRVDWLTAEGEQVLLRRLRGELTESDPHRQLPTSALRSERWKTVMHAAGERVMDETTARAPTNLSDAAKIAQRIGSLRARFDLAAEIRVFDVADAASVGVRSAAEAPITSFPVLGSTGFTATIRRGETGRITFEARALPASLLGRRVTIVFPSGAQAPIEWASGTPCLLQLTAMDGHVDAEIGTTQESGATLVAALSEVVVLAA